MISKMDRRLSKFLVFVVLCFLITPFNLSYAIEPSDENYDDDGGFVSSNNEFTLDGIKYTLTGSPDTMVTNQGAGSGGSALGNDGSDYYISILSNSVRIEAADGSFFKLNGFAMDVYADGIVTITPSTGTPLQRFSNGNIVVENVNVSGNSDFQYIKSITFSGNNMLLNLDDLDFSPPVPPTYTVSYNGNSNTGGAVPTDGSSYISGDSVTVLGNTGSLVRTGYTFAGWNTAANGSGTGYVGGNTFAMGSSNVTLYAQWTPVKYTVTYDGNTNTGGSVPTDGNTYNITNTVTVLGNTGTLVKTGYTFAGWNTAVNGSGTSYTAGNTFAMGSSNVTLYAQWTENVYTVTYNGNSNTGGAVPTDATSYHNGDTATVLGNTGTLVRIGYTFAGWNTAANGSGTSYSGGDTFAIGTSNVNLYAQWTPVNYTVTYNGNTNTGGSVPTDGNTYHITDTVTVLGNTGTLVKTGYTFAGWNTAANGSGTSYTAGNTFAMGSSNVTLYAQWTENVYTVTYNGNSNTGGAVPTDATSYHNGDTATVLGNTGTLVRTGYTFAGWNTAANGSGTSYTGGDTFSIGLSNVTLYAQWTPVNYTVTYNGNTNTGGSVPTDGNTYHITDTVTVLGNTGTLVKTGYTFAGWNTAANGSGTSYTAGNTFAMGSSNVTLYAQWTENVYTVTYNGNSNTGGAVPTDATSYHNGDTATVLGNTGTLVRTGYTFAGWNTAANGSGTSYSGGDTFAIGTSNVTLYAQWTPVNYTVTYNGNTNTGGSVPTDANTYHITDTATVLGNTGTLVKTGYTFTGWNTAANGSGTSYTAGNTFAMGSSNVTLYAQWTENVYTVTYNGNSNTGGAVPTDATSYHNGDTATVLGNTGILVRTGYTFAGWNTAANGSGSSYSGGDTFAMEAGNVTLYAQWTPVNYTVTYDGNTNTGGAVPVDGNTYNITNTVTVLGNTGTLVKTGYTFAGWNTAINGSGTSYTAGNTFAMGANNVTLYAQWTPVNYTVTYDGNTNTGGVVPVDGNTYSITNTVTVLGNTGTLVKTGYTFAGWNTSANGSGTSYTAGNTFAMGSSNVTLYAQWTPVNYTVTYDGNTNTGGAVPVDGNIYNITNTVTILGNTGTLVKTGYTFAGWNTAANGSGTSYTAGNTFAMGASNVTLYAKWTLNQVPQPIPPDVPAPIAPSVPTPAPQEGIIVVVNGQSQTAGKETVVTENNVATVLVSVDNSVVNAKIDEILSNTTGTQSNTIQVQVSDTRSEAVKVDLTGDMVKKLENNDFNVSIIRGQIEYVIPASEFTIDKVAERFGVLSDNLKSIKIEIGLSKPAPKTLDLYKESVDTKGDILVVEPMTFNIFAKVEDAKGNIEKQSINTFSTYVERIIEVGKADESNKITTGIVFHSNGTYSHVPTVVYSLNGQSYAKLNSLTNSDYAVIWNPVEVASVNNHWSKKVVNEMAARLIIDKPVDFRPDASITRGDFAQYLVHALGLYREDMVLETRFKDVSNIGLKNRSIHIAGIYGLVNGYTDGTFKPDAKITREEAMAMYQRAMKLTNLIGNQPTKARSFADYAKVSAWAKDAVEAVLSAEVFSGSNEKLIAPQKNISYAETMQALYNLMVKSKLF